MIPIGCLLVTVTGDWPQPLFQALEAGRTGRGPSLTPQIPVQVYYFWSFWEKDLGATDRERLGSCPHWVMCEGTKPSQAPLSFGKEEKEVEKQNSSRKGNV